MACPPDPPGAERPPLPSTSTGDWIEMQLRRAPPLTSEQVFQVRRVIEWGLDEQERRWLDPDDEDLDAIDNGLDCE